MTIEYINVKQITEKYPFTHGQIRMFLVNRATNGFSKCVRKIGKRIYIRVDLFEKWIESQIEEENGK